MKRQLHGITWNHTRGYLPLVATAQLFSECHSDVGITWTVHSLQDFAGAPIEQLVERYDLLVIDHPFSGRAARGDLLLPLDEFLPPDFLKDQAAQSVGASHASYQFNGHQWALAIDAATPIAGWRAELFATDNYESKKCVGSKVPETWEELLRLAESGMVVFPGLAIDCLMHFFMFCVALNEAPLAHSRCLISRRVGMQAYSNLRTLAEMCEPECLDRNPIATWQRIAESDHPLYCPFAYGYSNYARRGYATYRLTAGQPVSFRGRAMRTVLGGAGLTISSNCKDRALAVEYAQFVASAECQTTLYCASGGQPGHRAAWLDTENNSSTEAYFANTLPTLDDAWVRPRFDGYVQLQNNLASVLYACLRHRASDAEAMDRMELCVFQSASSIEVSA